WHSGSWLNIPSRSTWQMPVRFTEERWLPCASVFSAGGKRGSAAFSRDFRLQKLDECADLERDVGAARVDEPGRCFEVGGRHLVAGKEIDQATLLQFVFDEPARKQGHTHASLGAFF